MADMKLNCDVLHVPQILRDGLVGQQKRQERTAKTIRRVEYWQAQRVFHWELQRRCRPGGKDGSSRGGYVRYVRYEAKRVIGGRPDWEESQLRLGSDAYEQSFARRYPDAFGSGHFVSGLSSSNKRHFSVPLVQKLPQGPAKFGVFGWQGKECRCRHHRDWLTDDGCGSKCGEPRLASATTSALVHCAACMRSVRTPMDDWGTDTANGWHQEPCLRYQTVAQAG
ncbi:hypothetical protein CCM_02766 [Cordyceps militaris CM01]|uniref:Uncharacterized protein n=1 Tax=Cordyceps militaris (strain CM01) TaxID=983644 RepID=G3JBS2_CORMM|nr:uncharacterized protein CCM_02766 [Cordyceps militaris CM01]EGX94495.1 hypothetical protein CCM_02766 [Cordyceps militaris CM01]